MRPNIKQLLDALAKQRIIGTYKESKDPDLEDDEISINDQVHIQVPISPTTGQNSGEFIVSRFNESDECFYFCKPTTSLDYVVRDVIEMVAKAKTNSKNS